EVDRRVIDLRRLGTRAARAEEEDVARLEVVERDALALRDLAAHLHRCPAADRACQLRRTCVRLELVHPPDEARAVEASRCLPAEQRLQLLAHAAPDVWETDEGDGGAED